MSTTTPARSDAQSSPTWVYWLVGITFIILFIWLWNTANNAQATAQANAALLARPAAELDFVVGGPTRFAGSFEEAVEDAELEEFTSDGFLWTTVLVSNGSMGDLDDVRLDLEPAEGLEPLIVADLPSFGTGIDVELSESGPRVDLRDIDSGETARVFIGFDRTAFDEEVANSWASAYQTSIASMTVESAEFSETLYGRGISR